MTGIRTRIKLISMNTEEQVELLQVSETGGSRTERVVGRGVLLNDLFVIVSGPGPKALSGEDVVDVPRLRARTADGRVLRLESFHHGDRPGGGDVYGFAVDRGGRGPATKSLSIPDIPDPAGPTPEDPNHSEPGDPREPTDPSERRKGICSIFPPNDQPWFCR